MKQSILTLVFTAITAIAALIIGHSLGTREDVACAFGGLIGFVLSNIFGGHKLRKSEPSDASAIRYATTASIVAYFVSSICGFAFIGWLTGYLHHHGANAGGITGSLGGAILAIVTPQFRGTSIFPLRKELMIGLVLLLSTTIALVVWAMYFTDMKYWAELSMGVLLETGIRAGLDGFGLHHGILPQPLHLACR